MVYTEVSLQEKWVEAKVGSCDGGEAEMNGLVKFSLKCWSWWLSFNPSPQDAEAGLVLIVTSRKARIRTPYQKIHKPPSNNNNNKGQSSISKDFLNTSPFSCKLIRMVSRPNCHSWTWRAEVAEGGDLGYFCAGRPAHGVFPKEAFFSRQSNVLWVIVLIWPLPCLLGGDSDADSPHLETLQALLYGLDILMMQVHHR